MYLPDNIINLSSSVPSAPPTSVSTSDVTSSSITVQWGAVDCIHRNGDITGYSVRYGVEGSFEGGRTVVMIPGGSSGGVYEISGLTPSTSYTINVAARNSAGTGEYSSSYTVQIASSEGDSASAALVGSVAAVVIMLIISAVIIIIVVCVVKRSRHGQYSVKREVLDL